MRLHENMDRQQAHATRHRTARAGRHPGAGKPARRLSAPALRRHEPARDDRHGDRLQSEAADRRRADHGARRDHPGADPRPAAVAAARARHGADPHHAQHGRGGGDRAARRGDVCGPGDGGARGGRSVRRAAASLHGGAAGGAPGEPRRRAARHHPRHGARPLRPAARLPVRPRCAYATPRAIDVRPELRPWMDGKVRCHYPLGDATREARIAADRQSRSRTAPHEPAGRRQGPDPRLPDRSDSVCRRGAGAARGRRRVVFASKPARRSPWSANPVAANRRWRAW